VIMKIWKQFQQLNKAAKRLVYAFVALITYSLVGFLLLPVIFQPLIVDTLSKELDRSATLQEIKINPFSLSVTLNGLSVTGKHTDELFGFEKLYINFQAIALVKQIIAFDEITIVRPKIKLLLLSSGEYNFQDLIRETTETNKEQKDEAGWPFAVDKFRYVKGSVYFADKNRETAFYSQFEDISISLDDFSTKPGDGNVHHVKAETLRGTTIDWKGEFSLSPLKSNGRIELFGHLGVVSDYLQDQMLLKIKNGELNVSTDYEFMFSDEGSKFNVSNMLVSIADLDIRRKENDNKLVSLAGVKLDLQSMDVFNKKLKINKIQVDDTYINVDRDKKGIIDFGDLFVFQSVDHKKESDAEAEAEAKSETAQPSWDVLVSKVVNKNTLIDISDNSVKPVANHNVQLKSLEIDNLKPFSDEVALFELNVVINDKGLIALKGNIKPEPKKLDLDVDVKHVSLNDFQPYINDVARVDIMDGELSSYIKIKLDGASEVPKVNAQGEVSVSDLEVRDKKLKETFLSWKKLEVKNILFNYPQQSLEINSVNFTKPYLRLVMSGDGETNIQKLLISTQSNNTERKKNVKKVDNPFHADVKKINISDAKMDFSDHSLSPNFSAGIYGLKGDISGISSKQLSRAKVNLKGKVDKYAPVTINGDINPLAQDKFTEIKMLFKGIELTTFTPYSGKFAGYKIEKGKLSLDLNYQLLKNELVAENRVVLDQLTLGEETDSEEATSLPVNFALSLLKDSNGVIDINLPIRGNIEDPDFHYASLVWGALGNMIVGIVSSPFSALANLVGGDGEGLDYVVFSANSAEILETETVKLDSLAKALKQRPELHLEIRGVSSSLIDHDEMAYLKILQKLKRKPVALSEVLNKSARQEIVDYYEKLANKAAADLLPEKHQLTSQQKEAYVFDKALLFILNKTEITQADYQLLAENRAQEIQRYLIEVGKIPSSNVFLLDSKTQIENEFEDVGNALLKLPLSLKAK